MELKGSNHVAIAGSDDKRQITLTLVESQSGEILPFQIIYQGKIADVYQRMQSSQTDFVYHNETHWSTGGRNATIACC